MGTHYNLFTSVCCTRVRTRVGTRVFVKLLLGGTVHVYVSATCIMSHSQADRIECLQSFNVNCPIKRLIIGLL